MKYSHEQQCFCAVLCSAAFFLSVEAQSTLPEFGTTAGDSLSNNAIKAVDAMFSGGDSSPSANVNKTAGTSNPNPPVVEGSHNLPTLPSVTNNERSVPPTMRPRPDISTKKKSAGLTSQRPMKKTPVKKTAMKKKSGGAIARRPPMKGKPARHGRRLPVGKGSKPNRNSRKASRQYDWNDQSTWDRFYIDPDWWSQK
ncbi:hypothetical protein RvY_13443 [Ramazzottius varieornatus]|uniref:Uncharacterized protein n=1 Tax=Ramazzottius varieornatus TaxID=947166 RepID=A0A1D1VPQ1_RAMVA|nr:hypothetical protein RvY_13443 [Ramazzottius varieornatus]